MGLCTSPRIAESRMEQWNRGFIPRVIRTKAKKAEKNVRNEALFLGGQSKRKQMHFLGKIFAQACLGKCYVTESEYHRGKIESNLVLG